MKTISQAKIDTYLDQLKNNKIHNNHVRVLHFIKHNNHVHTKSIIELLNIKHQTATSCISNLLDMGLIRISGKYRCRVGKSQVWYSYYSFVEDRQSQVNFLMKRRAEKYQMWLKQGIFQYKEFMPEEMIQFIYDSRSINQQENGK